MQCLIVASGFVGGSCLSGHAALTLISPPSQNCMLLFWLDGKACTGISTKKTNGSKCPIDLNLHKIVKKDQDLHQQSVRGLRLASTQPHTHFDPKGCFKQQLKPSDWDGMTPFCRRKAPDLPTHTHTHNLSGRTRARAICRHSVSVYWQLAV